MFCLYLLFRGPPPPPFHRKTSETPLQYLIIMMRLAARLTFCQVDPSISAPHECGIKIIGYASKTRTYRKLSLKLQIKVLVVGRTLI